MRVGPRFCGPSRQCVVSSCLTRCGCKSDSSLPCAPGPSGRGIHVAPLPSEFLQVESLRPRPVFKLVLERFQEELRATPEVELNRLTGTVIAWMKMPWVRGPLAKGALHIAHHHVIPLILVPDQIISTGSQTCDVGIKGAPQSETRLLGIGVWTVRIHGVGFSECCGGELAINFSASDGTPISLSTIFSSSAALARMVSLACKRRISIRTQSSPDSSRSWKVGLWSWIRSHTAFHASLLSLMVDAPTCPQSFSVTLRLV